MISYVASLCVLLPITLLPLKLLRTLRLVSKKQCEIMAVQIGQCCARTMLRVIPFCRLIVISKENNAVVDVGIGKNGAAAGGSYYQKRDQHNHHEQQQRNEKVESSSATDVPSTIWVANHVSALDTFLLLAADYKQLRGRNKRPVKVIYWKGLDDNFVTRLFFHLAGFIPIDMVANGSGNPNEYDRSSFKKMVKQVKRAFDDKFDLLIMPEGQLNPTPEKGLLPVYGGAYGLSKIGGKSRPIRFLGIHGTNLLWPAVDGGILDFLKHRIKSRTVKMKAYPQIRSFESADDFAGTFSAVLGQFGATGVDLPREELNYLLFRSMSNKE